MGNERHGGRIAEHILERGIFGSLGIGILVDFGYAVDEFRIVHHTNFPGLLVHSVGGIDSAFQDNLHGVAVDGVVLVLADAAAGHDGFDDGVAGCTLSVFAAFVFSGLCLWGACAQCGNNNAAKNCS